MHVTLRDWQFKTIMCIYRLLYENLMVTANQNSPCIYLTQLVIIFYMWEYLPFIMRKNLRLTSGVKEEACQTL